jgi:hypothetical protein
VGIIVYLPSQDPEARAKVMDFFRGDYTALFRNLYNAYGGAEHWVKLEIPATEEAQKSVANSLASHYPLALFREFRKRLDPKGILGTPTTEFFLGDKNRFG